MSLPCQHIYQLSTDLLDLHPVLSCFRKPCWEENVCFLQPPSAFLFTFDSNGSQQKPQHCSTLKTIYYWRVEIKNSLAVITASDATQAVLHDLPTPIRLCDNSSILQLCAFLSLSNGFPDSICQPNSLISTGLHLTDCHKPTTLDQVRKMAFQCWHPVSFSVWEQNAHF